MKTDVLFIHRQLAFAVSIKQALERTGSYDVHPFTSVEAAMEYLRGHTQDVALVDFMMPVYSGEEVLGRLREVQPQITVVATPIQSEAEFTRLGLHGMLPSGFTAREFMPAIERALEGRRTGELPKDRGAGLLGRVQEDGEKRPPTSVIGYRSLESILDEGAALNQPPAPAEDATLIGGFPATPPSEPEPEPDAPTLIEGLPAATSADDLSFLNDVMAARAGEGAMAAGIMTDRLTDFDQFQTGQLDDVAGDAPVRTEPFGMVTEPLPPLQPGAPDETAEEAEASRFDPNAFDSAYRTRPLSELDDDLYAPQPEPRSAEFEPPSFAMPDYEVEADEEQPDGSLSRAPVGPLPPLFDEPSFDVDDPFASPEDDEVAPAADPVDYMAFLNLQPSEPAASDLPAWLTDGPIEEPPGPSEDEVYTGLEALFSADAQAKAPAEGEFQFEDMSDAEEQADNAFEHLLNELSPPEAAPRQRSEFDDLVASMSAQEQRPPLPARQQQYVDVTLTDDMSSLVEQIEQVRTGTLRDDAETPNNDEAVDLSAVLFVDEEEEGGDTPSAPAAPTGEPALASPDELAALFSTPKRDPVASAYDDFQELFAASQGGQPPAESPLESLFAGELSPEVPAGAADQDFDAFMASLERASSAADSDSIEFEAEDDGPSPAGIAFAGMAATMLDGPPEAGTDLEALFPSAAPFEDEQPDYNAMFGGEVEAEPANAQPAIDLFGGEWGDTGVLAASQDAGQFEDTGTVSDLMTGVEGVTGSTNRSGMLTRLSDSPSAAPARPERTQDTMPAPPPIDDTVTALLAEIELQLAAAPPPAAGIDRTTLDDSEDTPARRILETASEAEQADSSFSLDHLITNIEAQLPPNQARVQPLPSWVREPATPETLPEMSFGDDTVLHSPPPGAPVESEPPFDWDAASFDDTTALGAAARADQTSLTGDEETSWLEFIGPEGEIAAETVVAGAAVAGMAAVVQPAPDEAGWAAVDEDAAASARALQAEHIDDPYVAQLALSLTDVSLELTADAILLTRGQDIAAFAGRMSRDELLELRQVIEDDWEAAANDARIRFLRLPETGRDVMLYSRRTVEDLTLSLVFDGAMPLRDIRLQGKRLMDALAAVPETPVEIVLPAPADDEEAASADVLAMPRSPHAFVWLLRDPDGALARPVAQAIVTGLNQQMNEHGWRVREMRASDDHVYLLADSPDEQPPYVAVRELMRRSAQIAHVQNPSLDARALWAEAYLVVTPGRSLEADEIQQFIQFERMQ